MIGKFFNNLGNHKKAAPKPAAAPTPQKEYKRFNDAILVIMQDNAHGRLPIKSCNERAKKLIGYSERELLSADIRELLPEDTRELVNDYIEFDTEGRSIDQILQKITNFRLLGSRGREIPVSLRVIRGVSDATHPLYNLVMADTSLLEALRAERTNYSALNTREFLLRDMAQVIKHGNEYNYTSSFAIINFHSGAANIKRAERMIDSTKRDTDIIGQLNENTLIYIMPDTPTTNALTPLVRFKNSLPQDLQNALYVRYVKLDHFRAPADQIKDCLEAKIGSQL